MLKRLFLFSILCGVFLMNATDSFAAKASAKSKKGEQVVLTSDGGMEWNSNNKTLSATDRALVVRGDTALGADKITAFYREEKDQDPIVYQVKAVGNVIITTPKQVVYADNATYEIEKSVIILKGNPVKLIAGQEQMTARVLELWQDKNMAVAKENVIATKDARRLEAETVKAYFVKRNNKTEVEHFEAENNVVITNDNETVNGDFGIYWVDREAASLRGNVKITQGNNFITGEMADINMKTGVSRLQTPSEKGKAKGVVRGVFIPDDTKTKTKIKSFEKPRAPESLKEKESGNDGQKSTEKLLGTSDEGI